MINLKVYAFTVKVNAYHPNNTPTPFFEKKIVSANLNNLMYEYDTDHEF